MRTHSTPSTTQASQGARIVGKGNEGVAGPGPDVMAASTLDGDKILSADSDDLDPDAPEAGGVKL